MDSTRRESGLRSMMRNWPSRSGELILRGIRETSFDTPGWVSLLGQLRDEYDLVVLDCPPILARGAGAALAMSADRAIVVAAWDRTPRDSLRKAIRLLQKQARAPTGVFVNGVPEGRRFGRLRPS